MATNAFYPQKTPTISQEIDIYFGKGYFFLCTFFPGLGQNRTEENRTEQNRTEQDRTEEKRRTEQNRTENRTEQDKKKYK